MYIKNYIHSNGNVKEISVKMYQLFQNIKNTKWKCLKTGCAPVADYEYIMGSAVYEADREG